MFISRKKFADFLSCSVVGALTASALLSGCKTAPVAVTEATPAAPVAIEPILKFEAEDFAYFNYDAALKPVTYWKKSEVAKRAHERQRSLASGPGVPAAAVIEQFVAQFAEKPAPAAIVKSTLQNLGIKATDVAFENRSVGFLTGLFYGAAGTAGIPGLDGVKAAAFRETVVSALRLAVAKSAAYEKLSPAQKAAFDNNQIKAAKQHMKESYAAAKLDEQTLVESFNEYARSNKAMDLSTLVLAKYEAQSAPVPTAPKTAKSTQPTQVASATERSSGPSSDLKSSTKMGSAITTNFTKILNPLPAAERKAFIEKKIALTETLAKTPAADMKATVGLKIAQLDLEMVERLRAYANERKGASGRYKLPSESQTFIGMVAGRNKVLAGEMARIDALAAEIAIELKGNSADLEAKTKQLDRFRLKVIQFYGRTYAKQKDGAVRGLTVFAEKCASLSVSTMDTSEKFLDLLLERAHANTDFCADDEIVAMWDFQRSDLGRTDELEAKEATGALYTVCGMFDRLADQYMKKATAAFDAARKNGTATRVPAACGRAQ